MSSVSSMIPKAGQIDVPNPPDINPVDFIKQVVENINAQLLSIDKEIGYASQGDSAYVRLYFYIKLAKIVINNYYLINKMII